MKERPHLVPCLIVAVMLIAALADWPYGYYQLLRIAVTGVSIYIAVISYDWQKRWAMWTFIPVAILFNPLAPIHLSREIWQPIDVLCALLFLLVGLVLSQPVAKNNP